MAEYFVFCLEIKKFRLKQCDNDNNEKNNNWVLSFVLVVAKIYLSGPGQSGSNIVAWFCGLVDFVMFDGNISFRSIFFSGTQPE